MPPSVPCPSQAHKDPRDYYTNQLSVFYRDKGALQALLQGTEAVTQGRAFQILGKDATAWGHMTPLPSIWVPCLADRGSQGCRMDWTRTCRRWPVPGG